jgi:hypothetical protein
VRYWNYLSLDYINKDRAVKIFLAVVTSGTVASWNFWSDITLLWQILSGSAAIVGVALPILKLEERIKKTSLIRGKWIEVRKEYEYLWMTLKDMQSSDLNKAYKKIKDREGEVSQKEGGLPTRKKLREKCYREVLESRGLNRE